MLSLLYHGVGSVEGANLFRDRCFPLTNGTPCLNGSTGQIVITNAKINYSDVLNGPAADGNNYPTNLSVTNGSTHTITIGRSGLTALVATFDDQNSGSGGGSIITVESLDNLLIILNGSRANFSINQTLFNTTYIRNSSIPTCTGNQKLTSAGNGVFTCASDQDTDTNSGYTQWRIAQGTETPYVVTNNTLVKLLPGTGISISNDTTGNITITATGGSGASNAGWLNSTTKVWLSNNATNVSINNTNLFVDTTNNRVGIGTNTPETSLHVNGTTYFSGSGGLWTSSNYAKRIEMEGQGGFIIRNNSASGAFGWVAGNDVIRFTSATCNDNSCTATNLFTMNSGGGADFPVGVVQVNSGQFYVKNAVSNPLLLIGEGTSGGQYGGISWDIPDDILRIGNDGTGTGAISIPETNYVGIGLSNPSRRLTVYDTVDTYFLLQNGGSGTASTDGFEFTLGNSGNVNFWNWENGYERFATNAKERIRITADGLVGINTTAPTQLLDVNGSINATEIYVGGAGIKVCRSDGTNCPASGGGSGFTQWRIAGGTGTPYVVTNNTLIKLLAGTGISITNDTTGNFTITNTVVDTDTNSGFTQWRIAQGAETAYVVSNNTLIKLLAGSGISLSNDTTGNITITATGAAGGTGNQTGVGTVNTLPRWSNTTNLVASIITADANQANVSGNLSVGTGTNTTVSIGVAGANVIINTSIQVNVTGKVGIDVAQPTQKLTVNGNINATEIYVGGAGIKVCRSDGTNCPSGTGNSSWNQSHADTLYYSIGNPSGYISSVPYQSSAAGWANTTTLTNTLLNVNISGTLNVSGAIRSAGLLVCLSDGTNCPVASVTGSGWLNSTTTVWLANNNTNVSVDNGAFYIDTANNLVGIGITTPTQALDVRGKINVSSDVYIGNGTGTANIYSDGGNLTVNASTTVFITNEIDIGGVRNDGTGQVLCVKSDKSIGTCTSVVGVGGACTCA